MKKILTSYLNTIWLILTISLLSACQVNPMLEKINGWTLVKAEVNGTAMPLLENAPITLQTEHIAGQTRLFGRAPLNHYQMTMKIDGETISQKSDISTTRMAGKIEEMQLEGQYLQALRSVKKLKIEDKDMIFTSENPQIELHFSPTVSQ